MRLKTILTALSLTIALPVMMVSTANAYPSLTEFSSTMTFELQDNTNLAAILIARGNLAPTAIIENWPPENPPRSMGPKDYEGHKNNPNVFNACDECHGPDG
ncbi:MAG: hypothetical protein ACI8WB_004225 [Phenylobacterium sp.]|jgi:hypothetical protein